MTALRLILALFMLWGVAAPAALAQQQRPIPYPVMPPPRFEQAVEQGTRTATGRPGPSYWTNTAEYTIQATLSPATAMLRATETVRYHNNSPDTLTRVMVHLRQNLHREGVVRNRPQQVTGGLHVAHVGFEGQPLVEHGQPGATGYAIDGTLMTIHPPAPIPPGASVTLDFAWSFEVPEAGAPRMGQDGEVFYLGYWYPQVAVYDDLRGWDAQPYQGDGEFYMGYATYDVGITVPPGWLVAATGTLQNPDAVLSEQTRGRLAEAARSTEVVHVVQAEERGAGMATRTSETGALTWRFRAEDVRDFAFGTSDRYVWDATSAVAGDPDGDGQPNRAVIHALYRPSTAAWEQSAAFGQFTVEFLSDYLFPYPYPHMTAVEGILGGGMEFPMLTLIGGNRNESSLFGVTFHEIAHMWYPMVVGTNEKRYAWMDEGLTSFNTNLGRSEYFDVDAWATYGGGYYRIAGTDDEVEPMRHADDYPTGQSARGIASYTKPALALHALRGILGADRFDEAYREYARRWQYKHPTPYDLFNTFEDVTGEELGWFWTSLFFETWAHDLAVTAVDQTADGVRVTVRDLGRTPLPAVVQVVYTDGTTARLEIGVDVWLSGAHEAALTFAPGAVREVVVDPEGVLPDVNRADNRWER